MIFTENDPVARGLAEVRRALDQECRASGRGGVGLVAVSKFHPAAVIEQAILAGQREFGENRVQEATAKWPELRRRYADLRLHLLGQLQSNKVRQAVELFDVISVLDREKLARALAEAMPAARPGLTLRVQVNVGREPQKGGVAPDQADAFIERCIHEFALPVSGVMCVPPISEDPEPYFEELRALADRHGLVDVSMGMTDDFPTAIRCGSTEIRVGRAIFGARPSPPSGETNRAE